MVLKFLAEKKERMVSQGAQVKMDGWMDGWMDRWLSGWMGGWMDGWMDA